MKINKNLHSNSKSKKINGELNLNIKPIIETLSVACPKNKEDASHFNHTKKRRKKPSDDDGNTLESVDLSSLKKNDASIEEDQAESVDSGCVSDLTQESSWDQIRVALNYEYNFVSGLLGHTPLHKKEDSTLPLSEKIASNNIKDFEERKKDLKKKLVKLKEGESKPQTRQKEAKIKKELLAVEKQRVKLIVKTKRRQRTIAAPSAMSVTSSEDARKIYTKCGKLVFSKFDFSDCTKEKWGHEARKPDLNHYLSKVLREKEKVKSLKSQGKVEDASALLERKKWGNAMNKVKGDKVKDDPDRIAKSLQRKLNRKKKSGDKWVERERSVQKAKDDKQDKRHRNLDARKMRKTLKKLKSKKNKDKKGARVPGF